MKRTDRNATCRKILSAALPLFASRGYSGTSVRDIVDAARVTKPVLYYYFENKSALYQALVDAAYDERYRIIQEAAASGQDLADKLVRMTLALFEFLQGNRNLLAVVFATTFAAREEMPAEIRYLEKSRRNFEFVRAMLRAGQAGGELSREFDSEELANGYLGLLNIHVMKELVQPGNKLDRRKARRMISLFLRGAAV